MSMLESTSIRVCLCLVVVYLLHQAVRTSKRALATRRFGCGSIPSYPHRDWFLGLDLLRIVEESKRNNHVRETYDQLLQKHGNGRSMRSNMLGWPAITSTNPKVIQAVLSSHFDDFGVEQIRLLANKPWIGGSIVNSDGWMWKQCRNVMKPLFLKAQFADFRHTEPHIAALMSMVSEGETIDLQPLLWELFFDIGTEFVFGVSAEVLTSQSKFDVHEFFANMDAALEGVQRRVILGSWVHVLPVDATWMHKCRQVHALFDHYIDRALAEFEADKAAGITAADEDRRPFSLIRELIHITQDRRFLRDQLMSVFIPLYNAGGTGFGTILFFAARNPRIWAQLRAESLALGDTPPTFERLKSMRYLQAVIKEAFRLHPPLERLVRRCRHDTVLPAGGGASGAEPVFVAKGTMIDFRTANMHQDPAYWGSDAAEFRPERWLDASLRPRWEYLPFGGGARICPAQQLVISQYSFILARMTQTFAFIENRDPVLEFVGEWKLSKRSRNGVKVALHE